MAIQSLQYIATEHLKCACCLPADIVLCVSAAIVKPIVCDNEFPSPYLLSTMNATLVGAYKAYNPCVCVNQWTYTIEYDDELLIDGGPLLVTDITGIFCKDCLVRYFEDKLGDEVFVSTSVLGNKTLHTQHGCEYPLNNPQDTEWIQYPIDTSMLGNVASVSGMSSYRTVDGMVEWVLRMSFLPIIETEPVRIYLPVEMDEAAYYTDFATYGYVRFATGVFAAAGTVVSSGYFMIDPDLIHKALINEPIGGWNLLGPNHIGFTLRYRNFEGV